MPRDFSRHATFRNSIRSDQTKRERTATDKKNKSNQSASNQINVINRTIKQSEYPHPQLAYQAQLGLIGKNNVSDHLCNNVFFNVLINACNICNPNTSNLPNKLPLGYIGKGRRALQVLRPCRGADVDLGLRGDEFFR